jgi:hypothetical protein
LAVGLSEEAVDLSTKCQVCRKSFSAARKWLYDKLDLEFHFTVDLCAKKSTPIGYLSIGWLAARGNRTL